MIEHVRPGRRRVVMGREVVHLFDTETGEAITRGLTPGTDGTSTASGGTSDASRGDEIDGPRSS